MIYGTFITERTSTHSTGRETLYPQRVMKVCFTRNCSYLPIWVCEVTFAHISCSLQFFRWWPINLFTQSETILLTDEVPWNVRLWIESKLPSRTIGTHSKWVIRYPAPERFYLGFWHQEFATLHLFLLGSHILGFWSLAYNNKVALLI